MSVYCVCGRRTLELDLHIYVSSWRVVDDTDAVERLRETVFYTTPGTAASNASLQRATSLR